METTTSTSKRKIIDIKPETFRGLSVMAAQKGTNLKKFIENFLDELVESGEDAVIYKYLTQADPAGLEPASKEEQKAFEKKYDL